MPIRKRRMCPDNGAAGTVPSSRFDERNTTSFLIAVRRQMRGNQMPLLVQEEEPFGIRHDMGRAEAFARRRTSIPNFIASSWIEATQGTITNYGVYVFAVSKHRSTYGRGRLGSGLPEHRGARILGVQLQHQ